MSNRVAVRTSLLLLLLLTTTLPSWCRSVQAGQPGESGTRNDDGANHSRNEDGANHSHGGADNELAVQGNRDHPTWTSPDALGRAAVAGGAVGLITGGPIHGLLSGLGAAYVTAADPRIGGAYWAGYLAASRLFSSTTLRVILGLVAAASLDADGVIGEVLRSLSNLIITACHTAADLDARYKLSLQSMVFLRQKLWKLRRDFPGCVRLLRTIGDWKTAAAGALDQAMDVEKLHNVSGKLGEFFAVDHEWWEDRGFYHWWEENRAYQYFKRSSWF